MKKLTQEQLNTLLRSPETAELLKILQENSDTVLKKAAEAAKSGDTASVQALLRSTIADSRAAQLSKSLEKRFG